MIIEKYLDTNEVTQILFFTAKWCGACKQLKRTLNGIPESYKNSNDTNIYEVDVDENFKLSEQFNIRNLPTLLFIKNNNIESTLVGAVDEEKLINVIKKF